MRVQHKRMLRHTFVAPGVQQAEYEGGSAALNNDLMI